MNDRSTFLLVGVLAGVALGILIRELSSRPPATGPGLAVIGVPIPRPPAPRLDFGETLGPR